MKEMTIVYEVKDGLYVNMTNRCPCACSFCIRTHGDGAYGSDSLWLEREPTRQEIYDAIEARDVSRFKELVFCGYGEPTERLDDLIEISRKLKASYPGVRIRVNTNGLANLIAGESVSSLFCGCVDELSISLNASNAEDYYRICKPSFGIGSYDAMLQFAKESSKYVPNVVLTVVGTPDMTQERVASCRAVCDKLGLKFRVREYFP